MINFPDWMILAFAIVGIWSIANILILITIMIIGRVFDLHLDMLTKHKIKQQQRRLVRDVEILLHRQPTGPNND